MFASKTLEMADFHQLESPQSVGKTDHSDEHPSSGIHRWLKRNPSLEFCREVVQMNKQALDPAEVRKVRSQYPDYIAALYESSINFKVERKINWLIIPALSICYGFYYM